MLHHEDLQNAGDAVGYRGEAERILYPDKTVERCGTGFCRSLRDGKHGRATRRWPHVKREAMHRARASLEGATKAAPTEGSSTRKRAITRQQQRMRAAEGNDQTRRSLKYFYPCGDATCSPDKKGRDRKAKQARRSTEEILGCKVNQPRWPTYNLKR